MSEYRPTLYTASKLWHGKLWQELRAAHSEIEFTARWIDNISEMEANALPVDFSHYWTIDIQDVQRSDFTLLFASNIEEERELKGGMVEAGAALGAGKVVLVVNLSERHSWSYHPRAIRFSDLVSAFEFLSRYSAAANRHPFQKITTERG